MWHVSSQSDQSDQPLHKQGRGEVVVELDVEVRVSEVLVLLTVNEVDDVVDVTVDEVDDVTDDEVVVAVVLVVVGIMNSTLIWSKSEAPSAQSLSSS